MGQKVNKKHRFFMASIGILCGLFLGMSFQRFSFFSVFAQDQEEETKEYIEKLYTKLEGKAAKEEKIEEWTTAVREYEKEDEEPTTEPKETSRKEEEKEIETEHTVKKETRTQTIPCNCKKINEIGESSNTKKTELSIPEGKIPESTAKVTEHMKTDTEGNQKIGNIEGTNSEKGKEFYTIQTADETRFYLIIDRNGSNELVYFLTEMKEQDLLHLTANSKETLSEETSLLEAAIPEENEAKEEGKTPTETKLSEWESEKEQGGSKESESKGGISKEKEETKNRSWIGTFLFFSVVIVLIGGTWYFLKVYQRKGEDFEEDEEEDEEEIEDEEMEFEQEEKEFEKDEGEEEEEDFFREEKEEN